MKSNVADLDFFIHELMELSTLNIRDYFINSNPYSFKFPFMSNCSIKSYPNYQLHSEALTPSNF